MSGRALSFAEDWVQENINAEGYPETKDDVRHHVVRLLADAAEQGISRQDIEAEAGMTVEDFVLDAAEDANDREVDRLASKDP